MSDYPPNTALRVTIVCFGLLLGVGRVHAHEAELPPSAAGFRPHWEISLAAQLGFSIAGDRCVWNGSDVFACSRLGFIAFEFAPRYRFHHVAIGAVTQLGKGDEMSLLRAGAEVRFLPLETVDVEPWIGADVGVALLIDSVAEELAPAETFVTVAPAAGASTGLEFAVGEKVSFGISARLLWLALGSESERFQRKPSYDHQLVFSGGIAGTYRFD